MSNKNYSFYIEPNEERVYHLSVNHALNYTILLYLF